jgi:hypothetical protein
MNGNGHTEFESVPRSKSLSNNQSGSSNQFRQMVEQDMLKSQMQMQNTQFLPIVLLCCPAIVKGDECKCGY